MKSIGFGLERIGLVAMKWPVLASIFVVIITAISFVGIHQIGFSSGMSNAFETKRHEYVVFNDYRSKFSRADHDIFLLVEGKNLATPKAVNAMRNLVLDAGLIDGIQGIISMFSLRRSPNLEGVSQRLLPGELPDAEALAKLFVKIDNHPLNQGKLISKDRRVGAIVLVRKPKFESTKDYRRIADELGPLLKEASADGGFKVTISGLPTVRVTMLDQLLRDQFILNGLGALFGLILSSFVLRSIRLALITIAPSIVALIWVMGVLGLNGDGINIMTNVLPVLVLVITFADAMHLTYYWRQNPPKKGQDVRISIARMIRDIGPACALTTITTGIAFAALLTSESALVQSFGKAGAIGMAGAFTAVIVVHPLLIYWASRLGWLRAEHTRAQAIPNRFILWLSEMAAHATMKFAKPIVIVGLGLTVLTGAAHIKIEPAYSFLENIPKQSVGYKALKIIETKLGGTTTINLTITLPDNLSPLSAPGLAAIGKVHDALAKSMPDRQIYSLWSLARWIGTDDIATTAKLVTKQIEKLPPAARTRFISKTGKATMVSVYLPDEGAPATRKYASQIETIAKTALAGKDTSVAATGLLALSAYITKLMISRLSWSLVLAAVLSIVIICIAFRSWKLGMMAFAPNLLPIFIVEGVLIASGKGLQFTSAIALTVALGIALDDTIHFINRLMREAKGTSPNAKDVANAIRGVGPVLIATTLILCSGMILTMTSTLPMIVLFGQLTMLVLATALLADLVLLPALVLVFYKKGEK